MYIGDMRVGFLQAGLAHSISRGNQNQNHEKPPSIRCASFVTDNETDLVSTGQGQQLYDAMTCAKTFRRFTRTEGAEGHCEGMAPIVFWTAAFDWLDTTVH